VQETREWEAFALYAQEIARAALHKERGE
jgi:hypothetical protein